MNNRRPRDYEVGRQILQHSVMMSPEAAAVYAAIFCRRIMGQILRVENYEAHYGGTQLSVRAALTELARWGVAWVNKRDEVILLIPKLKHARKPIRAELRQRVFERDGFRCVYCGAGENLHCDHVKPVSHGGQDSFRNLVTACAPCNLAKGARTPRQWRRQHGPS